MMTNILKNSDKSTIDHISFELYIEVLRYYNLYQFANAPITHPSIVPATTPAATSPAEAWLA